MFSPLFGKGGIVVGHEMDMDLEVDMGTESEQKAPDLDTDSLSEAEYMEILGLEGMEAGGETTVEEAEEETQESDKTAAFTEHQRKKEKGRSPGENEQERMDPTQPGDAAESRKEWHSESKAPGNRAVDGQWTIREIPLSGVYINSGMDFSGMPIEQILAMQEREQQEEHFRKRQNEWDGRQGRRRKKRRHRKHGDKKHRSRKHGYRKRPGICRKYRDRKDSCRNARSRRWNPCSLKRRQQTAPIRKRKPINSSRE